LASNKENNGLHKTQEHPVTFPARSTGVSRNIPRRVKFKSIINK